MIKPFQKRSVTYMVVTTLFISSFPNRNLLSRQTSNQPLIKVDFNAEPIGTVTPALLGANNPMTDLPSRAHFDITTQQFPPEFVQKMKILGIRSLRFPGGNNSGTYHWENGIGPNENRPSGFNGSTGRPDSEYYHFGFMEFMDFLKDIEAGDPIICINFGTGTAAEASAWVEFSNGEPGSDANGDGFDQASIRVGLGYPEPYNIRFWEIGNELGAPYKHMFSWHFGQLANLGEDYSQTVRNYLWGGEQWQYMDMDQRQIGQRVVSPNDWTPSAALSDGNPGQIFFTKYPPVEAGSLRLWVWTDPQTGEEWQHVNDLTVQSPSAKVFNLDTQTGSITFGDGAHGHIPTAGAEIRVVYKSVDKDGLVDFTNRMKAVDPTILIGVPFSDSTFYNEVTKANFDQLPFDFIVDHPYQNGRPDPLEKEHWRIQWAALHQGEIMNMHRQNLNTHFGDQKEIGIVVSEYNLKYMPHDRGGITNNPWYNGRQLDYFGRSLDNGLFASGALISYFRFVQATDLWALHFHSLVNENDDHIAGWQLSALMGPSPFMYLNPSGHVYTCFSRSFGHHIIDPVIQDGPTYPVPVDEGRDNGLEKFGIATLTDTVQLPYLDAITTFNTQADTAILYVLNRASALPEADEPHHDITANVEFENSGNLTRVQFYELNGETLWSINSNDRPDCVSLRQVDEQPFIESFQYTFPAHSLTMILATGGATGINRNRNENFPQDFQLMQNYPNPFNSTTTINFSLSQREEVTLKLFNLLGEEIITLIESEFSNGSHSIVFEGSDLSTGVYIYQLKTKSFEKRRKMILLR